MVTGLFIDALLPRPWLRRFVLSWGVGLGSLLILFGLMADIALLTSTLHFYQLYLVPFFILLGGHLIFETYRGHPAGAWLLLAFAVFIGGALNDILYTNGVINTGYISTYTFMGFVLIQGGILAARASSAHRKARHLTKNLQEEVDSQTRELQLQTREAELARAEASDLRDKAELKNQRLRELDEQKTAFFQNMSHELRTPLTLILGPLEDEAAAQPTNRNLSVSTKNARRLLRLVNQLLDFQKLEAGKKELKLERLNLNDFAFVLGDYFASACSSKDIQFSVTYEGGEAQAIPPYIIEAESDALEKVAFNFLSNALKYTPQGGSIELGVASQIESSSSLGEGLRARSRKMGRPSSSRYSVRSRVYDPEYEGTGLGLALVKSLVEEMGGSSV